MRIIAVAASTVRTMVLRVSASGRLEQRWLPFDDANPAWSDWTEAPFGGEVIDAAAISGWPQQIEIFVLDSHGGVWNRWWWPDKGWKPESGFSYRGRPFGQPASAITALNAGNGHFNVFVESHDGRIATLPHVNTYDSKWRPCPSATNGLHDGWWPAFDYTAADIVYRSS